MARDGWGLVVRTGRFWVSKIGIGAECKLRLVLEQERAYSSEIPSGPLATLGIILHKAIAQASRADRSLEALLPDLIDSTTATSSATEEPDVVLSSIVAPSTLSMRIGLAKKLLNTVGSGPVQGFVPKDAEVARLPAEGAFSSSEVRLESSRYGLVGHVDHLKRSADGEIVVTEAKTGRIRDREGRLKPQYRAQLLGYGLLVHDNCQGRRILLRLCGLDGDETLEFESSRMEEAINLVGGLERALPIGQSLDSAILATHGGICATCDYRTRCDAYLTSAPSAWRAPEGVKLPMDVWGAVERVDDDIAAWLVRLYVRDPNGSLVSIAHVPRRLLNHDLGPGGKIFAFNLRSFERRTAHRPSNFAIADIRREYNGAHRALVTSRLAP